MNENSKPGKTGRYTLLFVIALIGGAAWYFWWHDSGANSLPPLLTVEADRGSLEQTVLATGKLEPRLTVEVGSQISGNIAEVLVDFNSRVEKGQVLARLDTTGFEADVREAEAELESADAALDLARIEANRLEQLRERDLVAQAELDQAKAHYSQASAARRTRLHVLERAQTELARCTIYSPIDGIVISRDIDVGQTVAASMTAPVLFTIANDLRKMHIHAQVPEADIGGIRAGQRATFTVDAYRHDFSGEVVQVRNQPIVESNVVMYDTIIEVENPEHLLKPGMTATVSIVTAAKSDVLRVRNTALRARLPDQIRPPAPDLPSPDDAAEGESWHAVWLVSGEGGDARIEPRAVRAGMSDGVHTEILDGLAEGDLLAIGVDVAAQRESPSRGSNILGPEPARF